MIVKTKAKLTRRPAADGPEFKPRVFIGSPCYGGMATMQYAYGLVYACISMHASGVEFQLHLQGNESLITRARNKLVADFLASKCTHLFFIDADVGFRAKDVGLLVMSEFDVVVGAYPMKNIGWTNVEQAVKQGAPCEHLGELGAMYAVNPHYADVNSGEIDILERNGAKFVEVLDGATGFMCIKRHVLERMVKEFGEELAYTTDYPPVGQTHHAIFETMIDPDTKRYLSEDYAFCRRWQQMGGKIHLCIDVNLTHTGTHVFRGVVGRLFEEDETKPKVDARADTERPGPAHVSEVGDLRVGGLPKHVNGDIEPMDDGLPVTFVDPPNGPRPAA